jgi:hypothetical protein
MNGPLQVRIVVEPDADPVIDALRRLGIDVGSSAAAILDPRAPPDMRLLTVSVVNTAAVIDLGVALRHELADHPKALALTNRVLSLRGPLDTVVLAFLDIAAIEWKPAGD